MLLDYGYNNVGHKVEMYRWLQFINHNRNDIDPESALKYERIVERIHNFEGA